MDCSPAGSSAHGILQARRLVGWLLVTQSCPTRPLGSSVHGILQARILEWVAIPFSRGSSQPRDQTQVSCITGRFFFLLDSFFIYLKKINLFNWRLITLQYCSGFCQTLTRISHGCTCIPHPETPSHLPPHPIPLGHPSAPALRTLSHASSLDWRSVSHMIIYMFECYSLKSSHTCLLPQSPKLCSLHLCLIRCLADRVSLTIFLNSIYMC